MNETGRPPERPAANMISAFKTTSPSGVHEHRGGPVATARLLLDAFVCDSQVWSEIKPSTQDEPPVDVDDDPTDDRGEA